MKSDPLDVTRAVVLSRATVRKMKQNLVWASVYNVLAIPVAAVVLYPAYGIVLGPEWSALLMSVSSIIVAVNTVLLKGSRATLNHTYDWSKLIVIGQSYPIPHFFVEQTRSSNRFEGGHPNHRNATRVTASACGQ
ncbi:MAG TPA: hypothetical protein VHM69_00200 [Rubrobacter sp.]|nr:hypothetical protein [Rubrobacter sp.]